MNLGIDSETDVNSFTYQWLDPFHTGFFLFVCLFVCFYITALEVQSQEDKFKVQGPKKYAWNMSDSSLSSHDWSSDSDW